MNNDNRIELGLKDAGAGCACCAPATAAPGTPASAETKPTDATVTAAVFVSGMTCSHCVSSVTEELAAIEGVDDVSVELNVGGASRVEIRSSAPIADTQFQSAVEEAGYALAPASS